MNARKKLNAAYLNGSLVIAVVIGVLAGSWTVFVLTLAALLVGNLLTGEIRPPRRNNK